MRVRNGLATLTRLSVLVLSIGQFVGCADSNRVIQLTVARDLEVGPFRFSVSPASSVLFGQSVYAVWMDVSAQHGWAVGQGGVVLRYAERKWVRDQAASRASESRDLEAVALDAAGQNGWATGDGVVLRCIDGRWTRDEAASRVAERDHIRWLWVNASGQQGWAVGQQIALRYADGKWGRDEAVPQPRGPYLGVVAMWKDATGQHGWAVGDGGDVLRYASGKWSREVLAPQGSDSYSSNAVWLDAAGTHAWAVGSRGTVLRYADGTWSRVDAAPRLGQDDVLTRAALDVSGQHGWGFSQKGIVRYDDGKWTVNEPASPLTRGRYFMAASVDSSGREGWAFSDGMVFDNADEKWGLHEASGVSGGRHLADLALDSSGQRGWAVGADGTILHYADATWTRDDAASRVSGGRSLNAVWTDPAGRHGWAVGDGVVLRYDNATWALDEAATRISASKVPYQRGLTGLWFDAPGQHGWAIGTAPNLQYVDGKWTPDNALSQLFSDFYLTSMWLDSSAQQGWAVGSRGRILHYANAKWTQDDIASRLSGSRDLNAVWLDASGRRGFAVGEKGTVLRFADAKWAVDDGATFASVGRTLFAVRLEEHERWGLAAGSGVVLRFDGEKWVLDEAGSRALEGMAPSAVALDTAGGHAWIVGAGGALIRVDVVPVTAHVDRSIESFSGTSTIDFDVEPSDVKVAVLRSDGATVLVPSDGRHFVVDRVDSHRFAIHFASAASNLAATYKGSPFQVRVDARFAGALSGGVVLQSTTPLYVRGSPWWRPWAAWLVALSLLNIGLVVAAVYSSPVRRLALDPTIRTVIGAGVFRYLVTEPLLIHVALVRRALFRDYRRQLSGNPNLSQWDSRVYVTPEITIRSSQRFEGASPDRVGHLLEALWQTRGRRRQVWLVEGRSGLGKTALFEQLARAALARHLTPFLVRLGSELSAPQEVAALMDQFGDLRVTTDVASSIVDGGGFVVLLDALNEDRHQAATFEFVRRAVKRNLVLLSTQFAPAWQQSVACEHLDLATFGPEQVRTILPEGWADRVIAAPYLAAVIRFPVTAFLLRDYIVKHDALPLNDFDLYESLGDDLEPLEVLTLQQRAWELFRRNAREFKPDDVVTDAFCQAAVRANILTQRVAADGNVGYRFAHERVHRFLVARYVGRQEPRPLPEWHAQIEPGLGRDYWADVLELLATTTALEGGERAKGTDRYLRFVRDVAAFAPRVFAERMYEQYQRYRDQGVIETDAAFQDWAASFLAALVVQGPSAA